MKKNLYIFLLIVGVVLLFLALKSLFHKSKTMSPFDYVKSLGATKSNIEGVGDRYDYPADPNNEYGFYSNNRAVRFSDGMKGSYNNILIIWDDKSTTKLTDIFK